LRGLFKLLDSSSSQLPVIKLERNIYQSHLAYRNGPFTESHLLRKCGPLITWRALAHDAIEPCDKSSYTSRRQN